MLFTQRNKRIKLSNRLGWGVRRGLTPATKFWIFGSITLGLASILIFYTLTASKPSGQVLGESTATPEPSPKQQMQFMDYQVEAQDTLFNISQKFNTPWTAIAQLNDLQPPFNIRPGQILKVPIEK
jgi:LysM repeat protein